MSDMSSLSHEYASTTDFSRQMNEAVLFLKKQYMRGNAAAADAKQLAEAGDLVRETVRALIRRLKGGPSGDGGTHVVPEDVLLRIEEKQRGNLEYFRQDLAQLERGLASRAALGRGELALLDSIGEAADASASATFRKLWRR